MNNIKVLKKGIDVSAVVDQLEEYSEISGYSSVEELVVHVLEKEL